jgi:hypothetical protein
MQIMYRNVYCISNIHGACYFQRICEYTEAFEVKIASNSFRNALLRLRLLFNDAVIIETI